MIDKIDFKLICMLQNNGRTTLKEMAEKIGYTSMGVKKRLDKLLNKDLISIKALINIEKFNLIPVIIFIEAEGGDVIRKIVNRFKNCPRLVNFYTAIGKYNLIALMIAEDLKTLESISTEECSIRKIGGIRNIEYYPIGEIHYLPHLNIRLNLAGKSLSRAPCGVNCALCPRYRDNKCLGCPTTKHYRGSALFKVT